MELRCPDPAGNPYLQLAAMLMAGLKGIEEGYEMPDPMEFNLYDLSDSERESKGIKSLPASLNQAITISEKSDLVKDILGPHSFERFIALKKSECEDYRIQVTQWELDKYYKLL
jgi:glutamine synthetase